MPFAAIFFGFHFGQQLRVLFENISQFVVDEAFDLILDSASTRKVSLLASCCKMGQTIGFTPLGNTAEVNNFFIGWYVIAVVDSSGVGSDQWLALWMILQGGCFESSRSHGEGPDLCWVSAFHL